MTTTNTNTTPNDTDRTNERTRSTPRAPVRALPRLSLSLSPAPARASLSIHDGLVPSFLSSRHRARTTSIVSIESTRRPTGPVVFLSSRHRARTTSIRLDREYEAKRHARVRVRVDVTSRASPPTRHRSPQRHLQYGGLWWYTHPCIRMGDFAFTLRTVCPCPRIASTRPLATDRPPARALTWRLGRMRMTRSIAHTSTRGRSRGNSARKHRSRRSCDGRSRRDIERVVRSHAFIHSFIHSFRGWIKR